MTKQTITGLKVKKMDKYRQTIAAYNQIAELYRDKFMELDLYNDTYDLFCNEIEKNNAHILEMACGPGNITRYLLAQRPDFKVRATDPAPEMLKIAAQYAPNADFELLDARDLGNFSQQFDALIAGFLLPYLDKKDCATLIANSAEKLLANGTIYLSYIHGNYEDSFLQTSSDGRYSMFIHYYPPSFIEDLLVKHHFTLLHSLQKEYLLHNQQTQFHNIVIARKQA